MLLEVLRAARDLGFLGPGLVDDHVDHALGFAAAAGRVPSLALDLGSGGGVPGLVLALHWPTSRWTLVDGMEKRTAFLTAAVARLGLTGRVTVLRARTELLGHDPFHRGSYDLVTARGFGRPPSVAEAAAPLLAVDGWLVVSEPPDSGDRWPVAPLAAVGLMPILHVRAGATYRVLRQVHACPAAFPRSAKRQQRHPLFSVDSATASLLPGEHPAAGGADQGQ